jgi:hypothetical protein
MEIPIKAVAYTMKTEQPLFEWVPDRILQISETVI